MNEYTVEQLTDMVESGLLEVRTNVLGERVYRPTDKFMQLHPKEYQEWRDEIDMCVISLWEKGYLDVNFEEEDLEITVLPRAAFSSQWDDLNDMECAILESLLIRILGEDNGR